MSLGLLLPMALFALAALVLPPLIHLVRRTDERAVLFAALRWLRPAEAPQQRRRFEEWLLLVLRLLLLALLALWLAQPVLRGHRDTRPWLLVVPGADPARAPSLPDNSERRWLAPGLPPLTAPMPRDATSLASLLREADATLAPDARLTVLVPERIVQTDDERPRLSRRLDWRVLPGVQAGPSSESPKAAVRIAIHHDSAHAGSLRYVDAAIAAWQAEARRQRLPTPVRGDAASDTALPDGTTHALWLASAPPPATWRDWLHRAGTLLVVQDTALTGLEADAGQVVLRAGDGQPLMQAYPQAGGRLLRLLAPLTPASMPLLLEPEFPRALQAALDDRPARASHAYASDWAPLTGAPPHGPAPLPLQPWLAWVLALLFALERFVAMRASRQVRA